MLVHGRACRKGTNPKCSYADDDQRSLPEGLIFALDLSTLMGAGLYQCKPEVDYEKWSVPTAWGDSKPMCLLGQQMQFTRRKQDSVCLQGGDYQRPVPANTSCECTMTDVECDFGYWSVGGLWPGSTARLGCALALVGLVRCGVWGSVVHGYGSQPAVEFWGVLVLSIHLMLLCKAGGRADGTICFEGQCLRPGQRAPAGCALCCAAAASHALPSKAPLVQQCASTSTSRGRPSAQVCLCAQVPWSTPT